MRQTSLGRMRVNQPRNRPPDQLSKLARSAYESDLAVLSGPRSRARIHHKGRTSRREQKSMRILVGTQGGLYVVRWVHGERSAQVEESHFEGDDVRAIVPAGRGFVAAVTGHGIWRSEDEGHAWVQVSGPFEGHQLRSLAVSPRNPERLYAGTRPAELHASMVALSAKQKSVALLPETVMALHRGVADWLERSDRTGSG